MGEFATIRNNRAVRMGLAAALGLALASCTSPSGEGTVSAASSAAASAEASYAPTAPATSEAVSTVPTEGTAPYLETVTDPDGALIVSDPTASDGFVGSYETGEEIGMVCKTPNGAPDKLPGDTLYEITVGVYDHDYTPAASYNHGVVDTQLPNCGAIDPGVAGD